MNEPTGYENEPEEEYVPLPPELYCSLYNHEMAGKIEDGHYYHSQLSSHGCQSVLELGCGTGRIIEFLRTQSRRAIGIDNSRIMLSYRRRERMAEMVEMDMCQLAFSQSFNGVIIPCNTLNLLKNEDDVLGCLDQINHVLMPAGLLVVQLHALTNSVKAHPHKRFFQFTLSDIEGGKLVKETVKIYKPEQKKFIFEERYKLRPYGDPESFKNYSLSYELLAFTAETWADIISRAGFDILTFHGDFNSRPFNRTNDSTLIITAQLS